MTATDRDPLPSWREGPSKAHLLGFVEAVSHPGSAEFVAPEERIAVFDNDGTLWSEQPMYGQLAFALERARTLLLQRPELAGDPLVAAAAAGDLQTLMGQGMRGLLELVGHTHAGMTNAAFTNLVRRWLQDTRHPGLGCPTPSSSTSRCWSCSPCCGPTTSASGSSPAVAPSSCGCSPRSSTASRRSA